MKMYPPLYVILIRLVGLVRSLYRVSFGHNCDVTLHVAFTTRCDVVRVGQQSPFVVKLMFCKRKQKIHHPNAEIYVL